MYVAVEFTYPVGVGGALCLYVGGKIQVVSHGVPLLHVLDHHLLRDAGVKRTLSLLLVELLGLRYVHKVQLLNLAVGAAASVKLVGLKACVG